MSDMPKFPLIVRNDEVGYISQHDDQSYGMFCPVAIVRDAKFSAMCASAPDLLEALEAIEHALKMGFPASEILDENSPIRDGIRASIAKARGKA